MSTKRPLIFAHRGASTRYPENTLSAFAEAFDEGADGVEVDVRETRDHALVIIHDETVDRTTDGHGFVAEMTLAEMRLLRVGGIERVPTLEEVFELAKKREKLVLIDVKVAGLEPAVVDAVLRNGMRERAIVDSFHLSEVAKVKDLYDAVETAVMLLPGRNIGRDESPVDVALSANAEYIHMCLPRDVTEGLVEEAHDVGLKVISGTTDEPHEILRLAEIGVDALTPNDPLGALTALEIREIDA